MRLIRLLVAALCLAAGVAIGALNPQPIALDLGVATVRATVGVGLVAALLLGVLLGGLALTASVVLPLRQRLRRALQAPRVAAAPDVRG